MDNNLRFLDYNHYDDDHDERFPLNLLKICLLIVILIGSLLFGYFPLFWYNIILLKD